MWDFYNMTDQDVKELQKHIDNMIVYEQKLKGKANEKKRLDEKHRSNE